MHTNCNFKLHVIAIYIHIYPYTPRTICQIVIVHYNERSTQCQVLRKIFFEMIPGKARYEWALATNVLKVKKAVSHDDPGQAVPSMKVTAPMKDDGLKTIEDLRRALISPDFYLNKNLYHCFCSGLEAGLLRGLPESNDINRLEDLLSIGAETHFRAELWYTLSEYGFFHNIGKDHRVARMNTFKAVSEAVREGRDKYGDAAWTSRMDDLEPGDDDEDDNEDEDEPESDLADEADVGDATAW